MPTLMSEECYESLAEVRRAAASHLGIASVGVAGTGGVFVPWSESSPLVDGIYYVAMGLDQDVATEGETYEESLAKINEACPLIARERAWTPFWQFLEALSKRLLGSEVANIATRWGWSNLLKVGWSVGWPRDWPPEIISAQVPACVEALKEELASVRRCLVFIGSHNGYGVVEGIFGNQDNWQKDAPGAGFWWLFDESKQNLFVHSDHPRSLRTQGKWDPTLDQVASLCRQHKILNLS